MDIQPQTTQPINDDQELAKVLAGVNMSDDDQQEAKLQAVGDTPAPTAPSTPPPAASDDSTSSDTSTTQDAPASPDTSAPSAEATEAPAATMPAPVVPETSSSTPDFSLPAMPDTAAPTPTSAPAASGELDGVKKEAISELRPLVDKLNLNPEEKFDTLLLLIRSTDDKTLIAPAHDAAKSIADESRRAQALLDIIKEIDFLSGQAPAGA